MTTEDSPGTRLAPDPAAAANEIAVAAAALSELADAAGLQIVARLLNLVRIEAEIKLSQIRFRRPSEDLPASSNPGDGT